MMQSEVATAAFSDVTGAAGKRSAVCILYNYRYRPYTMYTYSHVQGSMVSRLASSLAMMTVSSTLMPLQHANNKYFAFIYTGFYEGWVCEEIELQDDPDIKRWDNTSTS